MIDQASRRTFLRRSALGALWFALPACGEEDPVSVSVLSPGTGSLRVLDAQTFGVLASVMRCFVPFENPIVLAERADGFMSLWAPEVRAGLLALLRLLDNTGYALAGAEPTPFENLATEHQVRALQVWRGGHDPLLRGGYSGLRQLAMGATYVSPASWRQVGYPGQRTDALASDDSMDGVA
jgi:hypothetical protein